MKCGAAPHTWRNNSDRDLELNQTNVTNCKNIMDNNEAANKWYTGVQKVKGTLKIARIQWDERTIQKAVKSVHNFNMRNGTYFLQTCVLLAQVGIFDTTHLYSYVCTHSTADIPAQVYAFKYCSGA